jgi:protocatechuate 3,4-dioxygenase, beta subunit
MNTMPNRRRSLRLVAATALIALPALHLRAATTQSPSRRPTPAQTEGPFYPTTLPADSDADLLVNQTPSGNLRYGKGQAAWVEGTLTDADGRAMSGATIEIWQCDQDGHYHHPRDGGKADPAFQGFGRVAVDAEGRWRFRTLRPVAYSGRAPHIHAKIKLGRQELLTTQLYVQGDPDNARDGLWRRMSAEDRAMITSPYVAGSDGLKALYSLVIAA